MAQPPAPVQRHNEQAQHTFPQSSQFKLTVSTAIRPQIHASDLFYPNMVLTICKSMIRDMNGINRKKDSNHKVVTTCNNDEYCLDPLI
jgi:hypothetical protein